MAEDTPKDPLHLVFAIVGRIEQKVDDLRDVGSQRDGKLDSLTERVRQNQHATNNQLQVQSGQIEMLGRSGKRLEGALTGVDARLKKLEAPVARALHARQARRKAWGKITAWAAVVGAVMWFFLEPFYRATTEFILHRLMEMHMGGGG